MAFDSFLHDGSFFQNSSIDDIFSPDLQLLDPQFLSEALFSSSEELHTGDTLNGISDHQNHQFIPTDTLPSAKRTAMSPLLPPLPNQDSKSLSLYPTTQLHSPPVAANPGNDLQDQQFDTPVMMNQELQSQPIFDTPVMNQELQAQPIFDTRVVNYQQELQAQPTYDTSIMNQNQNYTVYGSNNTPYVLPTSYDSQKSSGLMQRSFSAEAIDQKPCLGAHGTGYFTSFLNAAPNFGAHGMGYFTSFLTSPNFGAHVMGVPVKTEFGVPITNFCGPGELHRRYGVSANPYVAADRFSIAASRFKVGRYSPEEKIEKIHRYRRKRSKRIYGKNIKYACRKIIADRRPRVRGRFARTKETEEAPVVTGFKSFKAQQAGLWANMQDLGRVHGGSFIAGNYPAQSPYYTNNNVNWFAGF